MKLGGHFCRLVIEVKWGKVLNKKIGSVFLSPSREKLAIRFLKGGLVMKLSCQIVIGGLKSNGRTCSQQAY